MLTNDVPDREAALREALAAARAISDEGDRARILAEIAPHLPDTEREAALREALAAARAISDEGGLAILTRSSCTEALRSPRSCSFTVTAARRYSPI